MPWDSSCGSQQEAQISASLLHKSQQLQPQPGSSSHSPKFHRRAASGSSSTDSLVRQSLEFEPATSARTMMTAAPVRALMPAQHQQQLVPPPTRLPFSAEVVEAVADEAKSSSGPISTATATFVSPVKRTHSLKDDLIKRFRSTFVNGGGGSGSGGGGGGGGGGSLARAADFGITLDDQKQQQQQPPPPPPPQQQQRLQQQQLNRGRPGSLRAATPGGSGSSSSSVVKVLPDKKLLNKASSSENLSQNNADLTSLTSLVQRKRDRSQDSADSVGSPPRRPPHVRKAPPPPPLVPAATTAAAAATASGDSDDGGGIGGYETSAAAKLKPPTGRREQPAQPPISCQRMLAADDFSSGPPMLPPEAADPGRDSPGGSEDQIGSDCEGRGGGGGGGSGGGGIAVAAGGGSGGACGLGHNRSNSFEFLQDVVQSRTAPKIRQPSAIRKISDSNGRGGGISNRDCSPAKVYGSSPPKAVSFNLTDEVVTYDGGGESSVGRSRKTHHRQQTQRSQGKLSDTALIDIHGAMVEMMENIVANQRMFLTKVKEGSISVANYRDNTKSLLGMQTRTIQQILDAIQSNEKSS